MPLSPHEMQMLRSLLGKAIDSIPVQKSCFSCLSWDGKCQKYDAVPPADVQANGCPAWTFNPDSAPF